MSNSEKDLNLLDKLVNQLGEHFDTVQVFTTRHEPGEEDGTVNCSRGCGNFFARYGQVQEWLVKENERSRQAMRNDD